jgi:hypothetical protein
MARGTKELTAAEMAAASHGDLDRELEAQAELRISIARDEGVIVGAFDRRPKVPSSVTVVRRGSGGPPVQVGAGTVHVVLSLAHPAALGACDEKRILNRHVRPLLRALTSVLKAQAHYFGRDWVSVAHRPVAWVGFAHDSTTRRTLLEAFVAVRMPFALTQRASFLGHPQATLEELSGHALDLERLTDAIALAYGLSPLDAPAAGPAPVPDALPWTATREEAIGIVAAGRDSRGIFRVGGELLVSRDAIARLEAKLASPIDDIGRAVDETLAARGVALEGVRSLGSIRDAIVEALQPDPGRGAFTEKQGS